MNNPSPQSSEWDKSRYFFVIGVVFFIVMLSFVFFWYGSNATGILMVAIPAVSLLISTCCYMISRKQDINDVMDTVDQTYIDMENEANIQRTPFNDRPPSYRLTWRRSFLKRFKSRTDSTHTQTEMETINIPSSPTSDTSFDLQDRRNSDEINSEIQSPDLPSSVQEIREVRKSLTEVVNEVDDDAEGRNASRDMPLMQQHSLPTYDEAIKIIHSQSDLTED